MIFYTNKLLRIQVLEMSSKDYLRNKIKSLSIGAIY